MKIVAGSVALDHLGVVAAETRVAAQSGTLPILAVFD
jgi:hypothetical protein